MIGLSRFPPPSVGGYSNLSYTDSDASGPPTSAIGFLLVCYALPFVCAVGAALNLMCLCVFARQTSVTTASNNFYIYIMSLCFFDALQAIFSFLVLPIQQFDNHIAKQASITISDRNDELSRVVHPMATVLVPTLTPPLMAVSYASVWTVVAITFQRFLGVRRSFLRWSVSSVMAKCQVIAIGIGSLVLASPTALRRRLKLNDDGSLRLEDPFEDSVLLLYLEHLTYVIFQYVLPLILISILNAIMIQKIMASKEGELKQRSSKRSEWKATLMLITIVVMFLALHSFGLFIAIHMLLYKNVEHTVKFYTILDIHNLLINLNTVINPLIYLIFTKNFRDIFWNSPFSKRMSTMTGSCMRRPSRMSNGEISPYAASTLGVSGIHEGRRYTMVVNDKGVASFGGSSASRRASTCSCTLHPDHV